MKRFLKTRSTMQNIVFLCLLASILCLVSTNRCPDPDPEEYPPCDAVFATNEEAYFKAGRMLDGERYVLPNGRWITPIGTNLVIDNLPLALVLSPDGRYVIVSNSGAHEQVLTVIDTQTEQIVERYIVPTLFVGLVMNAQGNRIYASGGGSNMIWVFSFADGALDLLSEIEVRFLPEGITLSHDEKYLLVVNQMLGELEIVDLSAETSIGNAYVGKKPYAVAISEDDMTAYVSCMEDNHVAVVDISDKERPRLNTVISTDKNPEDLVLAFGRGILFVANSDADSISVISTLNHEVVDEISVMADDRFAYGASPNALVLNEDETRLYIACAGENRIDIYDLEAQNLMGSVPTGWYPSAIAVNSDESRLYVTNAKGQGSIPTERIGPMPGTVSLINLTEVFASLPVYTEMTRENNSATSRYFALNETCDKFPVPVERGNETPINHVIYILRENKTYDAVLGDDERGDGEPGFVLFGEWYTPNIHALAKQFTSSDNFYNNAEESTEGHEWSIAGNVNDYITTNLIPTSRGDRGTDGEAEFYSELFLNPVTYPKFRFIFQNFLTHNVDLMIYGEILGTGEGCLSADPSSPEACLFFDERYVHHGPQYTPYFNTLVKDVVKVEEVIEDIERGKFPPFIFMSLPNDHTNGTQPGSPTPASMVADNDLATGMLVDYISHSPYWPETLIIILEDDPQQGYDHVEPHRTLCVLVSPYVKRGYISSVHYSEVNVLKTIEMIFNLPSMSIHDETAQALYDVFTSEPDFTPFTALPRNVPEETNPIDAPFAKESLEMDFSVPDANPDLHEIIWHVMKEDHKKRFPDKHTEHGLDD